MVFTPVSGARERPFFMNADHSCPLRSGLALVTVLMGAYGLVADPVGAQLASGGDVAGSAALADPLVPDTTYDAPGLPDIVHLPAPGSPLVALRLSIPVREDAAQAGAARILQILGLERARGKADPIGAVVEGTRTDHGIVYSVVGAVEDLDFLAYILREAVRSPADDRIRFRETRLDLLGAARRSDETASGRLAADLRALVAPGGFPLGGTTNTLATLTLNDLLDVWARSHRAADMSLVVAGDVDRELLLVSVLGLGFASPPTVPDLPPRARIGGPSSQTQILRHWYGEAHRLAGAGDPHGDVVAVLLSDHFDRLGGPFESTVQLWEVGGSKALSILAAAYPGDERVMRAAVGSALAETRSELTPGTIESAVATVRRRILFGARTQGGRVGLVGRHHDLVGDPSGARRYLDLLDAVTLESMQAFLDEMARESPLTAEIRP